MISAFGCEVLRAFSEEEFTTSRRCDQFVIWGRRAETCLPDAAVMTRRSVERFAGILGLNVC
jgi:hypothetical protein